MKIRKEILNNVAEGDKLLETQGNLLIVHWALSNIYDAMLQHCERVTDTWQFSQVMSPKQERWQNNGKSSRKSGKQYKVSYNSADYLMATRKKKAVDDLTSIGV